MDKVYELYVGMTDWSRVGWQMSKCSYTLTYCYGGLTFRTYSRYAFVKLENLLASVQK